MGLNFGIFIVVCVKAQVRNMLRLNVRVMDKDTGFGDAVLNPGQTIARFQLNIPQLCWVQRVVCVRPPCCDELRHVGCCWFKFDHLQTRVNNIQHVATHGNTVAKRTQHFAPNNVAIC